MEEYQSKHKSNTKVAQDEGQEDKDPIFKIKEDSNDTLMKRRPKPERYLKLGKYTKNPNPSLCDPFVTNEPSCQAVTGADQPPFKTVHRPRRLWNRKAFRSP